MVQISDLYPGIRVQIVSKRKRGRGIWNVDGQMDHWLGQVMTVRSIEQDRLMRMEEDQNEHEGNGWYWRPDMIERIAEDENMPDAPALDSLF